MFGLTTSKACQQTGVNLVVKFVTFTWDVEMQGAKLFKKIEKLRWQIRNKVLTKEQIDNKEYEIKDLEKQIKALKSQLTPLQVTKVVHKIDQ